MCVFVCNGYLSITGASPSDCLVSYPGQSFAEGAYLSAEIESVNSLAPADRGDNLLSFLLRCSTRPHELGT